MTDLTRTLFASGAWPRVRPLVDGLKRSGFQAFVVGGAIRDLILGESPRDLDLLTDAGPDAIRRIFSRARVAGQSFSVCLVDGIEIASCRHSARENGVSCGFIEADLARRDFTINAMALDPFTGALVDPFGGRDDLLSRIIRFTISPRDRIQEDPLRMVRACRFAARYGAGLHKETFQAIDTHRALLSKVAPERLRGELLKSMDMERPSLFFRLLQDAGLLSRILPSLSRCHDLDGGPHHGETVFEHCLLVGDALPRSRPVFRLAGYLHDVGKADAVLIKEGRPTFPGHEKHVGALARDLASLRFSLKEQDRILSWVKAHMRPLTHESTPRAVRRLLAMLSSLDVDYRDFLRMRIADKGGNLAKAPYTLSELKVRVAKIRDELAGESVFNINDLAVSGRDICRLLGIPPGPSVGQIKQALFSEVLDDPSLNTVDRLSARLSDPGFLGENKT